MAEENENSEVENLQLKLKAKQKEVDDLEAAWTKSKQKMSKVLDRFKALQEQSKTRKQALDKSEKARAQVEASLKESEDTVSKLRATLLLNNSGKADAEISSSDDAGGEALRQRVAELESEVRTLQDTSSESMQLETQLKGTIENLKSDLEAANAALKQERETVARVKEASQVERAQALVELNAAVKKAIRLTARHFHSFVIDHEALLV